MKIAGVIAEYNPFHQGHAYQLEEIRSQSQCDLLVVLMSGNVVQRGEFSVLDKWTRACTAIQEGADLVLELPLLVSLQGADYFAQGAVQLAAQIGCQSLFFGTESASLDDLLALHHVVTENQNELNTRIKANLKEGLGYPAAYQKSLEATVGKFEFDPSAANHLLGLAYIRSNMALGSPLKLGVIPRIKKYDPYLLSASQVRKEARRGTLSPDQVGTSTWQALKTEGALDMEGFWNLLRYRLTLHTTDSLRQILFVKEGFENRIIKLYPSCNSWEELVQILVSKRWTRAAINRLLFAILCDLKKEEWQSYQKAFWKEPVLRLLAFRKAKRLEIRSFKDRLAIKMLSKSPDLLGEQYQLQGRCDRILTLHPEIKRQEQNIKPFPIGI